MITLHEIESPFMNSGEEVMGFFTRKLSCEDAAKKLVDHLFLKIKSLPKDLSPAVFTECKILVIMSVRLATQHSGSVTRDKRELVLSLFEKLLDRRANIDSISSLLEHRGKQYSELFNEHKREIKSGKWNNFSQTLAFTFDQFCLGGGEDGQDLLMDLSSLRKHGALSSTLFGNTFTTTVKELAKLK
jgi:hypothetical protein